jgi:maleylacetate reductase
VQPIFVTAGYEPLASYLRDNNAKHVVIVTSPSRRFVDALVRGLDISTVRIFDGAKVHVPRALVGQCQRFLDESPPDTVLALGGGSAVGLGKALRLNNQFNFVAVPTTYSGSEMTSVYGITDNLEKQTGRDSRVRPDFVMYSAELLCQLPPPLMLQSLTNGLAHVISAFSTNSVEVPEVGFDTARQLLWVMRRLVAAQMQTNSFLDAARASSVAAQIMEQGSMGEQHRLAHGIGSRFDLEHSAVHSVLLPQFMALLRRSDNTLLECIDTATQSSKLESEVYDLLKEAGCDVSLRAMGVGEDSFRDFVTQLPELSGEIALNAYWGTRPE